MKGQHAGSKESYSPSGEGWGGAGAPSVVCGDKRKAKNVIEGGKLSKKKTGERCEKNEGTTRKGSL